MKEEKEKILISYGGGVNSTAMVIALYNEGCRYPIVFADTGNEMPETYIYIEKFFKPYLKAKYNAEIITLNPEQNRELYTRRVRKSMCKSIEDYCKIEGVIPIFMTRWCTGDFKITPIQRWSRKNSIYLNAIAFSYEEKWRADKPQKRGKVKTIYPLIDNEIDRDGCKAIISNAGLPIPPKSSCYFCIYKSPREWRWIKKNHPEIFDRAIGIEDTVSKKIGRPVTFRSDGKSVRELGLEIDEQNPLFPALLDYSQHACPYCHL